MDIYQRLVRDHDTQRALGEQISETSGDSAKRQELFAQYRRELQAHAAAEEQTFYAALIEEPDGTDQARHSIAEHQEADELLEELEQLDMASGGWIHKFRKLKERIEHHVDEEEADVFPLARKLFDENKAREMALDFERRKLAER